MQPRPLENTDNCSYDEFARRVLLGTELSDKLFDPQLTWTKGGSLELPKQPGRCEKLAFSENRFKFPKAHQLKENEKKAMALHSFANHELLAIEMMAAALLIYPHETEEDVRFKRGVHTALREEQKHLSLYIGRLNQLGFEFGDFPLNDFFWKQMEKLKTPSQYVAVMALTFEAANLDFAQYYAELFREFGDHETASILDTVLEDEIGHVAFGAHWMKKWREDKSLWDYYRSCLPWPVTPARSKGIGFDPNLHEKAVGDKEFTELLAKFDDDFKVTRRV
jgi:uncharacterized ferritin-like protein (DUF455 family)